MDKKKIRLLISIMPSWALAFGTTIIAYLVLMLTARILGEFKSLSSTTVNLTSFIIYGIITGAACFFISKRYPQSWWHVPVICNIIGITSAFGEPGFFTGNLWKLFSTGWILSVIGTIAGILAGRKRNS
ncbi:MAG TPA: hypothetical protein PKX27_02005 [Bacteroidales bacterium]|nr:hypothetical protein [Bacteroidales bacterium]HOX76013.1 hypothetical protein [Bacteroidales bacterium]HPM86729.1 hypothetical protein [Bacteroidales bacterium]HQM69268.1 hypothetical protein [Bacteroidales bacterium]